MKVFTLYSSAFANSLRLWIKNWESKGFEPKLISLRELEDSTLKQIVRRRGGGILVRLGSFNLSHKRGRVKFARYGARGWQKAPVVVFPPRTEPAFIQKVLDAR